MIYSIDLSRREEHGEITATRYPDGCAVGGDWVLGAESDEEALYAIHRAAWEEWAEPPSRHWSDFSVTFVDDHARSKRRRS